MLPPTPTPVITKAECYRFGTLRTLGLALALLLFSVTYPVRAAEPSVAVPSYNQFSDEDEKKIGAAVSRELESKYELLDNAALRAYLDGVTRRLADKSRRPEIQYTCKVLNTQEVGAFSAPGGYIYVTRGMLDFVQTESELAAVIGHEIGHIAARHLLNRFSLELRSQALWESAKRALPLLDSAAVNKAFESMGLPIVNLLAVGYDRGNETDADLLAFYNLIRAGWNPAAEIRSLDRIPQPSGESSLFARWLSSHPDPGERSRTVSAELAGVTLPADLSDDSFAFKSLKLGLDVLPKPKR